MYWKRKRHTQPDVRDIQECVKAWQRMQLFLACDERTTIIGHPYYHGLYIWYDDFSVVPQSMHEEFAAAVKENGKYVEMNIDIILSTHASERFRNQYAEYLRFLFESDIRITFGSDSHHTYPGKTDQLYPYLEAVGFRDGDFSELDPADLWQ